MVSLMQFVKGGEPAWRVEELRRGIALILEGFCLHAFHSSDEDYELFCAEMRELSRRFLEDKGPQGSALMVAGEIKQRLDQQQRDTEREVRLRRSELQMMIGMLSDTLLRASRANERVISNLHLFERSLDKAMASTDIRGARKQLEECLVHITREIGFHSDEGEMVKRTLAAAEPHLTQSHLTQSPAPDTAEADKVTGLPTAAAAARAVADALASPQPYYMVSFHLSNLAVIEHRYGNAVGNEYCLSASQLIASALRPEDRLFTLARGTYAALLNREDRIEAVRREVERMSRSCRGYQVSIGVRDALIRMSVATRMFPVWEWNRPAELIDKMIATGTSDDR